MTLTRRQLETLTWIREYRQQHGNVGPTHQEIANGLGVTKVTAWELVQALKRKGYVQSSRRSRSVEPTPDPERLIREATIASNLTTVLQTVARIANERPNTGA